MKKSIKLISILMVALMVMMVGTPVFAADGDTDTTETIRWEDVFDGENKINAETPKSGKMVTLVNKILGFIQWGTLIGGVILVAVLGVKYMMGSLEEKSQYQKSFVPLIVGIVVVFGASTIAKVLFSTFSM